MTNDQDDYEQIELSLDEAQEVLVRVFLFEGALRERERMTEDLNELSRTKTSLTIEEVQELISGKEISSK
jgi:hypothetical protein